MPRAIDWGLWEQWSRETIKLDDVLKGCYHLENCDCERIDEQRWFEDVTYVRKYQPRPVRPVNFQGAMVFNREGQMFGPYLYNEWLLYGWSLLDLFFDTIDQNTPPPKDWHNIYFRHNDDFYF